MAATCCTSSAKHAIRPWRISSNPDLASHVKRAAVKHPGLLQLFNSVAHRMMMDEGKDVITDLDARANMDFRARTADPGIGCSSSCHPHRPTRRLGDG